VIDFLDHGLYFSKGYRDRGFSKVSLEGIGDGVSSGSKGLSEATEFAFSLSSSRLPYGRCVFGETANHTLYVRGGGGVQVNVERRERHGRRESAVGALG
jgi:hypothetical protein